MQCFLRLEGFLLLVQGLETFPEPSNVDAVTDAEAELIEAWQSADEMAKYFLALTLTDPIYSTYVV